jgi:hypothetical protein
VPIRIHDDCFTHSVEVVVRTHTAVSRKQYQLPYDIAEMNAELTIVYVQVPSSSDSRGGVDATLTMLCLRTLAVDGSTMTNICQKLEADTAARSQRTKQQWRKYHEQKQKTKFNALQPTHQGSKKSGADAQLQKLVDIHVNDLNVQLHNRGNTSHQQRRSMLYRISKQKRRVKRAFSATIIAAADCTDTTCTTVTTEESQHTTTRRRRQKKVRKHSCFHADDLPYTNIAQYQLHWMKYFNTCCLQRLPLQHAARNVVTAFAKYLEFRKDKSCIVSRKQFFIDVVRANDLTNKKGGFNKECWPIDAAGTRVCRTCFGNYYMISQCYLSRVLQDINEGNQKL